jgi:hypothetical protein
MLQSQRLLKTVLSVTVLLLLGASLCSIVSCVDEYNPKTKDQEDPSPRPGPGPGPSPKPSPKPPPPAIPVAVVLFHDDYDPPENRYYFRENAFSQFDGKKMVQATLPGADGELPAGFPSKREVFSIFTRRFSALKTVPTTICLLEKHQRPFGLVNVRELEPRANPDPKFFTLAYGVESGAVMLNPSEMVDCKAGNPDWSPEMRTLYLEGPSDPRYRELGDQILAKLPPHLRQKDFPRIWALKTWLDKNTTYSLQEPEVEQMDFANDFLFGKRHGKCVHFAHALTYLLRAQGIPARLGNGYMVAQKRRVGSSLVLARSDRHAWCEVFLYGLGWVIIDVSAAESIEPDFPEPSPEVVRVLTQKARQTPPPHEEHSEPFPWEYVLAALALLVLSPYAVKFWRRMAPRLARPRHLYRVCYRAVLDRLAELGLTRRFGKTREEFAERLAPLVPAFVALSAAHVRSAVADREDLQPHQWRQLQAEAEAAFAGKFLRYRRNLPASRPSASHGGRWNVPTAPAGTPWTPPTACSPIVC